MSVQTFPSSGGDPLGVVIVVHGLNTKPSAMDELIAVLTRRRFHCVRVSLYSHDETATSSPADVEAHWLGCMRQARLAAAEFADLPTHCVAFSVGALVAIRSMDGPDGARFARMFLLAPPLGIRLLPRLVRLLVPLWRVGIALPSAAPKGVRERSSTPLSEYGALLRLRGEVRTVRRTDVLAAAPTLVYADARDELVSCSAVERWITRNRLTGSWRLERLPRGTGKRTYRHLVVSQEALGPERWQLLTDAMVDHLCADA